VLLSDYILESASLVPQPTDVEMKGRNRSWRAEQVGRQEVFFRSALAVAVVRQWVFPFAVGGADGQASSLLCTWNAEMRPLGLDRADLLLIGHSG
jgi:hypothetical protein